MSKRFTVTIEEDEFGELILPIPDDVCDELGWEVDDILEYSIESDQSFILRKVNNETDGSVGK
tara:strand:- start:15377 stop:15565 length:189 start_codon:yes stop_codon:yes gene_type:complete